MKLADFRRRMDWVRFDITDRDSDGVCVCLKRRLPKNRLYSFTHWDYLPFDSCAQKCFDEIFRPEKHSWVYWLDNTTHKNYKDGMTSTDRRLLFVDAFQGFVESTRLYRQW